MNRTIPAILATVFILASATAKAERGRDGHVGILYWQAPSILNPYLSGGTKDLEAASLILEPLARHDENGALVPWLAESVPTVINGGVSDDLTTITWTLRDDLVWSDGSPVTSADVVFTANYCLDPAGGCAGATQFNDVVDVAAIDERTVRITFGVAKPYLYGPFVGANSPILQKAQFAECTGARAPECTDANFNPIGTGPFRVVEFRSNDVISLEANPHYRDSSKPAFATVTLKGGGDAASAGRAVLETGEFDYAWNLQLAPDVLDGMQDSGQGVVVSGFGTLVERLIVNLTDPSLGLGDERSTRTHLHPFLSDHAVRKALSMAIDRATLVEIGYGPAGRMTCNIVPAPEPYTSTANDDCLVQDIDGANRLLDDAGWLPGADGIRQKDGVACRSSTRPRPMPCARTSRPSSSTGGPGSGSKRSCATSTHRFSSVAIPETRTPTSSSLPTSRCTPTASTGPIRSPTSPAGDAATSHGPIPSGRAEHFTLLQLCLRCSGGRDGADR